MKAVVISIAVLAGLVGAYFLFVKAPDAQAIASGGGFDLDNTFKQQKADAKAEKAAYARALRLAPIQYAVGVSPQEMKGDDIEIIQYQQLKRSRKDLKNGTPGTWVNIGPIKYTGYYVKITSQLAVPDDLRIAYKKVTV